MKDLEIFDGFASVRTVELHGLFIYSSWCVTNGIHESLCWFCTSNDYEKSRAWLSLCVMKLVRK